MSINPEQLKAAFNALREPLFVLSKEQECIFANDALFAFLGLKREEEAVLDINSFWPDIKDFARFQEEMTLEFRVKLGDTFLVKLNCFAIGQGNTVVRVLSGLSRTDPLQNFHSQRLETLGLLAGGVAHDFNNILTGILGHATYLKTILPQIGPHVESLAAIEDGTRKGSSITQQILNFSKRDSSQTATQVDVGELIVGTCTLLRRAIPSKFMMETDVPKSAIKILCIESQLAQIIANLVFNARDALEEQGAITVSLRTVVDKERLSAIFKGLELSSGVYAEIVVSDNGHGIAEDVQKKIFEPYFSTKKEKGTGLGLSTVAAIVKSLGGAIAVNSVMGSGTNIYLYLPAVTNDEVHSSKPEKSAVSLARGNERILVVDDEYPVRNVLVISLQHLGYSVESAGSGAEALSVYNKNNGEFDLIIMDMLMPNMSGEQLFFELKKLDPNVRAIVISGFSSEDSIRSVLQNGGKGFLPKPFTIEELSRRVRACLDEK